MQEATRPRFCDQCGTSLPPQGKFCPECGNDFTKPKSIAQSKRSAQRHSVSKLNTLAIPVAIGVVALIALLVFRFAQPDMGADRFAQPDMGTDEAWTTTNALVTALTDRGVGCHDPLYQRASPDAVEGWWSESVSCYVGDQSLDVGYTNFFIFRDTTGIGEFLNDVKFGVVGETWVGSVFDEESAVKLQQVLGGRLHKEDSVR